MSLQPAKIDENDLSIVAGPSFPVYAPGSYWCSLIIKRIEKTRFTPKGEKANDVDKEPGLSWNFHAHDARGYPLLHTCDDGEQRPIVLTQITGVSFGSTKSNLVKLLWEIAGRKLTHSEMALLTIPEYMLNTYEVTILNKLNDDGDMRHVIASVKLVPTVPSK